MVTQWVVNASPVILLGKTGHLELLRHLGPPVCIPEAAVREVEGQGATDISVQALSKATWLIRTDPGVSVPTVTNFGLGDGESAVLTQAITNPGFGVILDDRAARNAATALGIPHLGTLGVVMFAKTHGFIPQARSVIEDLRRNGMYLSDRVVERALAKVDE